MLDEGNIPEIRILPEVVEVERSERRPSKASIAIALRLRRIKPNSFVDRARSHLPSSMVVVHTLICPDGLMTTLNPASTI